MFAGIKGAAGQRPCSQPVGIKDPSSIKVEEVGLMAVVHQIYGLHESDFRLVYIEHPPPESEDVKFQFVLIRDNEFGKDAVDIMESRELFPMTSNQL